MKELLLVINEDRFFLSHRTRIAEVAARNGWSVTLVTKDTGQRGEIEKMGFNYIELPINPTGMKIGDELKTLIFLYKLYRKHPDAIIHHVGLKNMLWGGLASRLTKTRGVVYAVSGLGTLFGEDNIGKVAKVIQKFLKFSMKKRNISVIFQNHDDERLFLESGIVDKSKICFIKGSGVDLSEYNFSEVPLETPLVVIFTARMLREKGVPDLVAAAELLRGEFEGKVEFWLCGGLSSNPSAMKEEEINGMIDGKYIKWLGHRCDISDLLRAQPTRVSGINPGQNIVSGIVDMVRVVDANGMGEDSVAYEVSGGQTAATKKDDGTAPATTDPVLRIAKITPVLISTLSYVSRNIQRTTPLNYQGRVSEGALTALRKKTGGLIVTGDPAATIPEPTGILKAAAIEAGSDVEIGKIDEKTLRTIALKYGGANNVEGGGVLLLNKDDLIAFGDIRGTSEKKAVYEIEFSENSTTTGTIKDGGLAVKFCIVDELPALSKTTSAAGSYCMAYGKPLAYQLDLFGPYTVEVSRDYKFAEGLLAVMGEAMIGGNVITENGFLRIKKKASAGA